MVIMTFSEGSAKVIQANAQVFADTVTQWGNQRLEGAMELRDSHKNEV
jgi:hypothetical protein